MVHTMSTALLGLTLGCSRCHDHKYDSLSQLDDYRVASCFAEVGFSTPDIDLKPKKYQREKTEFDKQHAPFVDARTKFEQDRLPQQFIDWSSDQPTQWPFT